MSYNSKMNSEKKMPIGFDNLNRTIKNNNVNYNLYS